MFVREIMKTNIVSIDSSEPIKNACNIYKDKKIGSLLITEKNDVVGIVTERDIIERTICLGLDPSTTPIKDIMTKEVKTVNADDRINYAVEILKNNHFKRLPVVENNELVGIITVTDIALSRPDIRKFLKPEEQ